ncbi:MAG: multidrug effflux MFS transporter [Quadrisphaera sp.]
MSTPAAPTPATLRPAPAPVPRERDFTALPLRRRAAWVVLLGSLAALGAFTIDLYLPAFPALESELGASASQVQLTLTGTMVGVALGMLLVGPLSDAVGRRRPLLVGLGVHVVASLLCALAPSIEVLSVLRVLQGLGTSAASVIALAVVRDKFEGRGAARLQARLMVIVGVSPLFAPSIGGVLLELFHWRGLFVALAVLSASLAVAVGVLLPETVPARQRRRFRLVPALRGYVGLLRDPALIGLVLVAGMSMSAIFGYVAQSSFAFQQQYGLSAAAFGLVFATGGGMLVLGTQVNGSLVHRFSSQGLLVTGLSAGAVSGLLLVAGATTGAGGLLGLLVPLWLTMFSIGLVMPNSPVLALERHATAAGATAALLGASQHGVAAAAAPLGGSLPFAPRHVDGGDHVRGPARGPARLPGLHAPHPRAPPGAARRGGAPGGRRRGRARSPAGGRGRPPGRCGAGRGARRRAPGRGEGRPGPARGSRLLALHRLLTDGPPRGGRPLTPTSQRVGSSRVQ